MIKIYTTGICQLIGGKTTTLNHGQTDTINMGFYFRYGPERNKLMTGHFSAGPRFGVDSGKDGKMLYEVIDKHGEFTISYNPDSDQPEKVFCTLTRTWSDEEQSKMKLAQKIHHLNCGHIWDTKFGIDGRLVEECPQCGDPIELEIFRLPYFLMMEQSFVLFNERNYRSAVIEAYAALENLLCLSLMYLLEEAKIPSGLRPFSKKFGKIWGRIYLKRCIGALSALAPQPLKMDVSRFQLRNKVVHAGYCPSKTECEDFLNVVLDEIQHVIQHLTIDWMDLYWRWSHFYRRLRWTDESPMY